MLLACFTPSFHAEFTVREYALPPGSRPHDVAPAVDGGVWYTAQAQGALGYLDPSNGKTAQIPLGEGSAPHGVIVGPDGAPWITDGGLNAIVRVDSDTESFTRIGIPTPNAQVRQILGRPGEIWVAESARDKLLVIYTR